MTTTFTQAWNETFHVVTCYTCGCAFGINECIYRRAVEDKKGSVFCPACGRETVWNGESKAEQVRREMQRKLGVARRRAENLEVDLVNANNKLRGTKAALTKTKKRIENGVCPCCHRSFKNLRRHMNNKHPEYAEEEAS